MGNTLYGLQRQCLPWLPTPGRSATVSAARAIYAGRTRTLSVHIAITARRFLNGWPCTASACTLACRQNRRTIYTQRLAEDCALYTPLLRRLAKASGENVWEGFRSASVAPNLSGALVLLLLVSL